jgi:hypothetical protein
MITNNNNIPTFFFLSPPNYFLGILEKPSTVRIRALVWLGAENRRQLHSHTVGMVVQEPRNKNTEQLSLA